MSFVPVDPDPISNYPTRQQLAAETTSRQCDRAWRRFSDAMERLERIQTQLGYAADDDATLAELTGLATALEAAIKATGRAS